jgi:predicted HTH domain antitoxin
MSVVIPDDILTAAKISEAELKLEIAILLYQKYKISSGKARRLAGMNLIEFRKELASRGICVHYDVEDLQADIKTLQELGQL